MANSVENLDKHLQLAVRQLKIISGKPIEIPETTFEIVDEIYGLLLSLTETRESPTEPGSSKK